jgi:hypothetical protein
MSGKRACLIVLCLAVLGAVPAFAGTPHEKTQSIIGKIFGVGDKAKSPPPIVDESDENRARDIRVAPLSSKAYDSQMQIVQDDLKHALHCKTQSESTAAIGRAQADLAPIVRRTVIYQGTTVTADNRPMRSTLARLAAMKSLPQRQQTLLELANQIRLVRQDLSTPASSADTQKSASDALRILRKNEFASDPVPPPSALQRKITEWEEAFGRWFSKRFSKGPHLDVSINPQIAKDILIVVCGSALALLAYLLFRAIIGLIGPPSYQKDNSITESALAMNAEENYLVTMRDYDRLRALASQKAEAGEFRDAYRLVYLAKLVLLDSVGIIKIHKAKTNWEYVRHLLATEKHDLHALLHPTTEEFDRIWYGYGAADQANYDEIAVTFDKIKEVVLVPELASSAGRKSTR